MSATMLVDRLNSAQTLRQIIEESALQHAKRPALWVNGKYYNYSDFFEQARNIARIIIDVAGEDVQRVAILSQRNEIAYIGIIAALLANATYVPLNPRFPTVRNFGILTSADVQVLICDEEEFNDFVATSETCPLSLTIIVPGREPLRWGWPIKTVDRMIEEADDAYIMFTSGSTGRSKGVPVSHRNVLTYVSNMVQLIEPTALDRFAQQVDLTFDLSIHDMFVCWATGACLYVIPQNSSLIAHRFIQELELTMWLSVPTTAALNRSITPKSMPSLRHSLFCGEALSIQLAAAWQKAAYRSVLRNLYGPTEATVAFTEFKWRAEYEGSLVGSVPIGCPLNGQEVAVVNEQRRLVPRGAVGELLLCGAQVTRGYWRSPDKTSEAFINLSEKPGTWYCTGDLVREDPIYGLVFCGRIDHQLKIRGYRQEGLEIETHLRAITGSPLAAVVGWPVSPDGGVLAVVGYVVESSLPVNEIVAELRKLLPAYAVPSRIVILSEMPMNANGKIDYGALSRHASLTRGGRES